MGLIKNLRGEQESSAQTTKYEKAIADCNVGTDDGQIKAEVENLIAAHFKENDTKSVYQFLLGCVDLTTLSTSDSEHSVAEFTKKVNDYWVKYPDYQNVASVCVYSNFAEVVRANLEVSDVNIVVCSGNFPSSQAHLETKIAETALAVADGADEVDVVINMGYFIDGAYEELCDEISELKHATGGRKLKVILETGLLQTAEKIKAASVLAMYSGADFIKTSTGKIYPGASLEAAYVMCKCIKDYYDKFGTRIGFKAAGGIRTTEDAVKYYTIVKEVLGKEWLDSEYFRIGASSLANNLFKSFADTDATPF